MSRGQFYLDKANAKLWGVCAGIADYTGVNAFWIRLGAVLLTLVGFTLTIPIYIAVALIAEKRPLGLYTSDEEERLLARQQRRHERGRGDGARPGRLRTELSEIDRRVTEVEAYYRNSNPRLSAEIDALR